MPFDPRAIRGVILDMDGLLLDSERPALELALAISAELGQPWPRELGLRLIGLNSRDVEGLIRDFLGTDYPLAAHQAEFGRRYEALIAEGAIRAKTGVVELLETLRQRGLPAVVATSTRRSRALPKLERAGLAGYIHGMVCGDEVSRGKPAPDIYLAAAALLGLPAGACLALEDSNTGVRAALAAGARILMVPDLLQPAADIVAAGVPVLDSLTPVILTLTRPNPAEDA